MNHFTFLLHSVIFRVRFPYIGQTPTFYISIYISTLPIRSTQRLLHSVWNKLFKA